MSNEVAFNSLEKDDVKMTFKEGSSDLGKPTEEEVAQHKRTRLVLVVLFGIIVLAMVVAAVIIIIVSPACEQKKGLQSNEREKGNETTDEKGNETTDDLWWKRAVMYQIYPRSFFDSNDDGNGDLSGISKKLEYFSGLGVNAFLLNPIYDPKDFMAIEKTLGSMEDFETFVNESHNKGFKVILDFVPNHTSKQHPWFVESSKNKTGPKNDWYVWADAGVGGNGTNPPNNWVSEDGGSAWEYENSSRQQFYFHQFKKDQPDLNLRNREVIKELKKVLEFWLNKGVDGFRIKDVQYFLEDANLTNETKTSSDNASYPSPNTFSRNFTYDLEENRKILKEFQEVINNGSKRLLIADVEGARSTQYYDLADIIQNVGLITKVNRSGMTLSQGVKNTVVEYIDAVPAGKVPNWLIGNIGIARVGSRLGHDVRNAMNVLQMTLPGIVTTYYGEEIGMLNGVSEKTPMQWSDESNAGFSSRTAWVDVAPSYLTLNVKIEKANNNSFYNNYIKLAALRKELPFATGEVKVVQSDPKVFAFLRSQGDLHYLVVINFGDKWDEDIAGLSGRGLKVFDSEEDTAGTERVDVNKLTLNPGQAVIVSGTSEDWLLS